MLIHNNLFDVFRRLARTKNDITLVDEIRSGGIDIYCRVIYIYIYIYKDI